MNTFKMLEAIGSIDDALINNAKSKPIIKKHSFLKPIAAAAVIALSITAPLPAMTVFGSDKAYNILYNIAPGVAQTLKPVKKSCIDNGIEMEVVSADVVENNATFCIALHDVGNNIIDSRVDLFDSYSINSAYDCISHCNFSEYDEKTKTAFFAINIETENGEKIKNDKITFSVNSLIYGKNEFHDYITNIDLNNIQENPATMNSIEFRGSSYEYEEPDYDAIQYLVPGRTQVFSPVDGVEITGVGYIDGALHIQLYFDDIVQTDNHGYISLIDKNGDVAKFDEEYSIAFWDKEHIGSYEEQIFSLPYDELSNYKLYGDFITSSGYLEGDWRVTFSLDENN